MPQWPRPLRAPTWSWRSAPNGVSVTTRFISSSALAGASAPMSSTSLSTIANQSSLRNACLATGRDGNRQGPGEIRVRRILTMALTRADVEHVARLARLALTDDEIERLTVELGAVLEHAADVASLDLAAVPPTAHPLPLRNVLRDDVVRPSLDRDEVLAAAPEAEDGRFRVPRILEAP